MTLRVTCVKTPEDWEKARTIRLQVFVHEQHFDEDGEFDSDDVDPSALHFIGTDVEQNKVVAAARVLVDDVKRKAKLSRVAVLSECRGKRYGVTLMNAVENYIRDRVDLFVLAALIEKKGFYEKCGYQCINDEIFVDEGAKQCWMTKPANPPAES
ncbi:Acetyltransferase (GNAT) family [Phytophthora palmivora]|uniref:Acetyltransferase (GNAT) family n=1 Tax=Phytophthora palmivora TaxID=4796 RepID=A0A2P4Y184_9STRA|nr:Acetyltransferase (GNAT) family [Phytophthora palmivora]